MCEIDNEIFSKLGISSMRAFQRFASACGYEIALCGLGSVDHFQN